MSMDSLMLRSVYSHIKEPLRNTLSEYCQNHSADDAVRARAKGPCLERENWRLPSHPERRERRNAVNALESKQ